MTATQKTLLKIISEGRGLKKANFDPKRDGYYCSAYNALRATLSGEEKSMLEFGDDVLGARARPLSWRKRLEWLSKRLERRGTLTQPVLAKHSTRFSVWSYEVERGLRLGDLAGHMQQRRQRFGQQGEGMIWATRK